MEIQRYNRLKAAIERVQSEVCFDSAKREQPRSQVKRTCTWLSEKMGHNICTISRWMTNKVQPSVEQLYEIARHLNVDVNELLVSSK